MDEQKLEKYIKEIETYEQHPLENLKREENKQTVHTAKIKFNLNAKPFIRKK